MLEAIKWLQWWDVARLHANDTPNADYQETLAESLMDFVMACCCADDSFLASKAK